MKAPLIVKYAQLQERHAQTLQLMEQTNERNAAMTEFFENVIKPYLESASLFEAHPCIRGDCKHVQAEHWKCRVALIELIKENAETARKILAPPKPKELPS